MEVVGNPRETDVGLIGMKSFLPEKNGCASNSLRSVGFEVLDCYSRLGNIGGYLRVDHLNYFEVQNFEAGMVLLIDCPLPRFLVRSKLEKFPCLKTKLNVKS